MEVRPEGETISEPKTEAEMQQLFQRYGIRPYQDLLGGQVFYFHLLLQVGDRIVRITPPQNLGEAIEELAHSDLCRRILGPHIFDRYVELKRKEWDEYRVQVTPWEHERYLSIL